MCDFQLIVSSNTTPRNLNSVTRSTVRPLISMLAKSVGSESLVRLKITDLVFSMLSESLLAANQGTSIFNCLFISQIAKEREGRLTKRLASSAKRTVERDGTTNGKSLMQIKKSNGPRTEPCRTPQLIFGVLDLWSTY